MFMRMEPCVHGLPSEYATWQLEEACRGNGGGDGRAWGGGGVGAAASGGWGPPWVAGGLGL